MANSRDGVQIGTRSRGTFELLENFSTILGTIADSFWPFVENVGSQIVAYKNTDRDLTSSDEAAARNLQSEFAPFRHSGGVYSYYFDKDGNQHLSGVDIADFSRVDGALSVGCWCLPLSNDADTLIAKYDDVAAEAREWRLWIDSNAKLDYEEFDESADAFIHRPSSTSVSTGKWVFLVGTGFGDNDEESLHTYINGVLDEGTAVQSGTHVKMEALAAPVLIGAGNVTAVPNNEFNGRIALPFITGKQLSATEIGQLYQLGRELLGV